MLPDRVSNPGPLTYATDCATRLGDVHRELMENIMNRLQWSRKISKELLAKSILHDTV